MDDRTQPPPEPDIEEPTRGPASHKPIIEGPWPRPEIGADGEPIYDQTYFLKLAKCGRDIWNAWRAAHGAKDGIIWWDKKSGYVRVTFAGVDFTERGNTVDFSGFDFGHGADLSGANFGYGAPLSGASFGHDATLSGARFGDFTDLSGVSQDAWEKQRRGRLNEAPFKDWSQERKHAFLRWPANAASRPDRFSFISFAGARFEGRADFTGRTTGDDVDFTSVRFDQPPKFDSFDGYDLYGARIGFHGRGLRPWPRAKWRLFREGWTANSTIGNQLRHLRKLADDSKNHDLERDLYIEERKAERGIYLVKYWRERNVGKLTTHVAWIVVMGLYGLLADYGRSFMRPAALLIATILIVHTTLWFALGPNLPTSLAPRAGIALSHITDWVRPNLSGFGQAARGYALAHAVPFLGPLTLDKDARTVLICRGDAACVKASASQTAIVTPFRLQALTLVQGFLSTLCFFFAGLALRNFFRVK
ncbi:MAG: hypothetical protein GC182_11380 [Rhodopseudomonas sp.]|nr:hypothetical protein [Rhodopseudomonas sp.]